MARASGDLYGVVAGQHASCLPVVQPKRTVHQRLITRSGAVCGVAILLEVDGVYQRRAEQPGKYPFDQRQYFKSRIFTIGGRFDVFHTDGKKFAEVKGNWKGWTFQFLDLQGNELGLITKKWAGIGKEFFSSADNYVISLNQQIQRDEDLMALLIMAGLSVDIVLKERK